VNEGIIFRFLTKPVTTKKFLFTLRAYVVQYHAARVEKEQLNELSFLAQRAVPCSYSPEQSVFGEGEPCSWLR